MQKILLFLLLFGLQSAFTQSFKVVGYLPQHRFDGLDDLEFNRLTHINIAFANPDARGHLSGDSVDIMPVVTKAHQQGCKVFISLGGGYLPPEAEANWDSLTLPARRPAFIRQIIQYVQEKQLDGVDVDLEWQYVHDWYSSFILELRAALTPLGKALTAALPGTHRYPQISAPALAAFDWINIMAYDLTGPWTPLQPGPHSPYEWTEECIQYWKGQGVTAEKLTLGVPFYGYDFDSQPVEGFTYNDIVNQDPANARRDQVGQKYWNGTPTIRAKTELALQEVNGIMIWEIGGDACGENAPYSLLRAINAVVEEAVPDVWEASPTALRMESYPVRDRLSIRLPGEGNFRLRIYNTQGETVLEQSTTSRGPLEVRVANLPGGMYGISVYSGRRVLTGRFVKR